MATKTIVIDNPEDYQEGDLFSGTYKIENTGDGEGLFVVARDVPLKGGGPHDNRLYAWLKAPYVDVQSEKPESGKWHQVKVTREVPIPSKYIKFVPGSLVEYKHGSRYMVTTSGGWVGSPGTRFAPGDPDIRATIENREVFEKNYTLISGSYEDADD